MSKMNHVILKRTIDVFLSFGLIIFLSPLLLLISVLLLIEGEGKILFMQERVGQFSKPFKIFKFRTMKEDAPNVAAKDINNVIYVTKIGSILRKTSLDELPQLFNILCGQMSFVGPRPLIPNEGDIIDLRKKYHVDQIRPGLTGWAQVIARDTTDNREKLKLDLYYKENESILLDLKIMLMTFTSLRGK